MGERAAGTAEKREVTVGGAGCRTVVKREVTVGGAGCRNVVKGEVTVRGAGCRTVVKRRGDSWCVVYWKPYCKQVPFDPLKCIAGLMYNVKRIGVWKYEAKMSRDQSSATWDQSGRILSQLEGAK